MEWNQFEEANIENPEITIDSLTQGFFEASKKLIRMSIKELSDSERIMSPLSTTFQYELIMYSEYVSEYKFIVLLIGYNVTIYPVVLNVDSEILKEILPDKRISSRYTFNLDTEEELIQFCNSIFKTNKFVNTVSGLMKIARKKSET